MPTKEGELNINEVGRIYELSADIKYIKMNVEQLVKVI